MSTAKVPTPPEAPRTSTVIDRLPVEVDHKKPLASSTWQACVDPVGGEGINFLWHQDQVIDR
jgi:hypothetical protein